VNKKVRTLLLVLVLLLVAIFLAGCNVPQGEIDLNAPQDFWQAVIVFPMVRALMFLHQVIAGAGIPYSYGWAIIGFTIFIKLLTLPLTWKQLQSAKAQQVLQPKIRELQEKYGKDRQKLAEEQQKLFKEAGVNPLGGCLPLLIQMPILIGLYQALYVLASPGLGELKGAGFYWIKDLSFPDLTTGLSWITTSFNARDWGTLIAYLILPVLMIVTQLALQKMSQPVQSAPKDKQDDQTRLMGQMMMFMPLMFGYITLTVPSGLTLYWTASNILSIVPQYFITGWGSLADWIPALKPKGTTLVGVPEAPPPTTAAAPPTAPARPKRRRRRK
jgi:YidC/Oxa1 family membrane protein insertase